MLGISTNVYKSNRISVYFLNEWMALHSITSQMWINMRTLWPGHSLDYHELPWWHHTWQDLCVRWLGCLSAHVSVFCTRAGVSARRCFCTRAGVCAHVSVFARVPVSVHMSVFLHACRCLCTCQCFCTCVGVFARVSVFACVHRD